MQLVLRDLIFAVAEQGVSHTLPYYARQLTLDSRDRESNGVETENDRKGALILTRFKW